VNRRYRIVEEFGPTAARCRDQKMGRDVIIRRRPRHAAPSPLRREARVLERAARGNPNVPRVLDSWIEGDDEHLVFDHVAGTPLAEVLRQGRERGKPYFSPDVTQRMIGGLIKGLMTLHRNGICHGDLKPDNLVVARGNRLVMIDFGSAWSGGAPAGGRDRGTPGYAAPEQWREERLVDARADQFSVSVIAYEMLTNELPWDGLGGTVAEHVKGKIPAPTLPSRHPVARGRSGGGFSAALDAVVARGLAIDKDARFETTGAWLRAVEAAGLSGQAQRDDQRRVDVTRGAVRRLFTRLFSRLRGAP
jgi:serine/threonine-protein kinase